MYVESTTLQWIELFVIGGLGAIATPFGIYFLSQNAERKKELSSAFQSIRDQRDTDLRHSDGVITELRDKVTKLQTTVDIKRETVDRVQEAQGAVGIRVAVVEQAVKTISDSQVRSEQNWQKVSDKLEILAGIKEKVETLADDVSELRQAQNRN